MRDKIRIAYTGLPGYCPFVVAKLKNKDGWADTFDPVVMKDSERYRAFENGDVGFLARSLHTSVGFRCTYDADSNAVDFAGDTRHKSRGDRIVAMLFSVKTGRAVDKVVYRTQAGEQRIIDGKFNPKVLENKRIAYVPGGLEHFYLYFFFLYLGLKWPSLDHPELHVRNADRHALWKFFEEGQADVTISDSGKARELAKQDGIYVLEASELPYDIPIFATVLVANGDLCLTPGFPEMVDLFCRGWYDAAQDVCDLVDGRSLSKQVVEDLVHIYGEDEEDGLPGVLKPYDFFTAKESKETIEGSRPPSLADRIRACRGIWRCLELIENSSADVELNEDEERESIKRLIWRPETESA